MSYNDDIPHYVTLPNGNRVNIDTVYGATALLQQADDFNYFSESVKKLTMWQNNGKMKFKDKRKVMSVFGLLALNADNAIFREKIPLSEIQCWLDYVIEGIKRLTTNKSWIRTGDVTEAWLLLEPCPFMFLNAVPVALAFKSEFFQVLSSFIKARRRGSCRALPSPRICVNIAQLVSNAVLVSCTGRNAWISGKSFKKLDTSGVLEEFLRCAAVPYPSELADWNPNLYSTLYWLQISVPSLYKRFQQGEPCGDALRAILDGRDESRSNIPSQVEKRLQGMASALVKATAEAACCRLVDGCYNCGKGSTMYCARCKFTYYCSDTCQRAHWMEHKFVCTAMEWRDLRCHEQIRFSLVNMLEEHRHYIDLKLTKACQTLGAKQNEVILELDFVLKDGVVPALEDPPELRIAHITDYKYGRDLSSWVSAVKEGKPEEYDSIVGKLSQGSSSIGPSDPCCWLLHRTPTKSILARPLRWEVRVP